MTFNETGLPVNTTWEVSAEVPGTLFADDSNTTAVDLVQQWPNGTYNFTASADLPNVSAFPANATFTVEGGNVVEPVTFLPAYPILFYATGLPILTAWTVLVKASGLLLNGTSVGPSLTLEVPAGGYSYSIGATGFNASPPSGSGSLDKPIRIDVVFSPVHATPGTILGTVSVSNATLYLNGVKSSLAANGSFRFTVPPGTYTVIVTAVGYYTYYNQSRVVSGQTVTLNITLSSAPVPSNGGGGGPLGIDLTGWIIIGILGVLAAAMGTAVLFLGRR